ncbi:GntR family transcriptional regulator [Hydrocarboniclastica marina]|uniref:GntR family transcriptional regulator n=1 Tax=Hydrocarboniclastica marina TaxID=2259620 RepID=A0A4P7XLL4_9ALTE|nr:GntR family transcriptional regulator [Hydrocarboniclastica marina]MAM00135.1 GntR family transcriptional regulator [Alteromonadaceae bacterium]QCF27444.1 GntR family transcriptional regulator [Hydrocarboniclastica marina]|tara:strand:+ start:785 stop:1474 length:690 start_codon:yes stop_codon:yes gene_type:complete
MATSTRKWTTDRIYHELRQGIMNLELYPGSRITETELAQRFGVSRTPVREALQRLAVEGYLTIRPKHGCYIRPLDVFELAEYYDVRVGLELEGLALMARRIPYRGIAQLAEDWDPDRAGFGLEGTEQFKDAEEEFHIRLAELSGNPVLVQYLRDINDHIRIVRRLGLPDPESVMRTYREHHEVCQRILANDLEGAASLLRDHVHESQAKSREVTLAQLELRRRERVLEG